MNMLLLFCLSSMLLTTFAFVFGKSHSFKGGFPSITQSKFSSCWINNEEARAQQRQHHHHHHFHHLQSHTSTYMTLVRTVAACSMLNLTNDSENVAKTKICRHVSAFVHVFGECFASNALTLKLSVAFYN